MKSKIFPWQSLKVRVTVFTLAVFVLGMWSLSFYIGRSLQADMEQVLRIPTGLIHTEAADSFGSRQSSACAQKQSLCTRQFGCVLQ